MILGLPIIFVSIPIGYLSYNTTQVSKNILEILNNPKAYQNSYGISNTLDSKKLKAKLKENTFFFDFFIEYGVSKNTDRKN
jgi:hypothetical protein